MLRIRFGVGAGTLFLAQAIQPRPGGTFLDVGCGAGALALRLAASGMRATGTDLNARAILMSRINAAMNGIEGAEFVQGDLFAPVDGRTFDLIASHPPFAAMPEGFSPVTFLYGGARGDEFALRILSEGRNFLNPRAVQ